MKYQYTPYGVCSSRIVFDLDGDIVKDVAFEGGCSGNAQGVSALVNGMAVDEVIKRLEGISCGLKPTSCPDQLSKALQAAIQNHADETQE